MIKRRSKEAFTLLEILVCIFIIGLVGVVVGTKGHQLLAYHRFRCTVQTFGLDLGRFQVLSMIGNADIVCTVVEEGSSFRVFWKSDSPLPIEPSALSYKLEGVKHIEFEGKRVAKLEFSLFSSGRISPPSALTFVSSREEKAVTVDLTYPLYLKEGRVKPENFNFIPSYPIRKKDIIDK